MSENQPGRQRLFVALWPDPALRAQLSDFQTVLQQQHPVLRKSKAVASQNIHLTLCFLGSVSTDQSHCLFEKLSAIKARPFQLVIDRWGGFAKSGAVWVGPRVTPQPLIDLVTQIGSAAKSCVESYQPGRFAPHVTLFRKAKLPASTGVIQALEWNIKDFALVESKTFERGVEYTVLQQWQL